MAKLFETVKKGTTLLLNGKFNNEVGEVIATVMYTEVYGEEMRITYKGTTRNGCFTHTMKVEKKAISALVEVISRKWKKTPIHRKEIIKTKYDYEVKVLY